MIILTIVTCENILKSFFLFFGLKKEKKGKMSFNFVEQQLDWARQRVPTIASYSYRISLMCAVWSDVGLKRSPILSKCCPKMATAVVTLPKSNTFQESRLKSPNNGLQLKEFFQITLKNGPIWSPLINYKQLLAVVVVVVAKWSACATSTLKIRVQIPLDWSCTSVDWKR